MSIKTQVKPLVKELSFIRMNTNSFYFEIVTSAFKKLIEPIYGDQSESLAKIKRGKDRICELMFSYENPVGLVVYKNKLQNEYGLDRAMELKTLFLFNPEKNSGKGFGSSLFQRIDEIAEEKGAKIVYCTASSKVENSIKCALKNGFKVTKILEKNKNQILYLLIKTL
ncbi:MAG: hypothetical protein L0207_01040 [Chlamydiae bacterium]|nr:hypothetical protein [Chlamydiota bacterium]